MFEFKVDEVFLVEIERRKKKKKNRGKLTFLSIEEEKSLMKSVGIAIGRKRTWAMLGQSLGDNNRKSDDTEGNQKGEEGPFQSFLGDDYAA